MLTNWYSMSRKIACLKICVYIFNSRVMTFNFFQSELQKSSQAEMNHAIIVCECVYVYVYAYMVCVCVCLILPIWCVFKICIYIFNSWVMTFNFFQSELLPGWDESCHHCGRVCMYMPIWCVCVCLYGVCVFVWCMCGVRGVWCVTIWLLDRIRYWW